MNWILNITIEEPFDGQLSEEWFRQVVEQLMLTEAVDQSVELSLLITDDETVHELNREYRKIDRTTDVLAFAFQEESDFPTTPDGVVQLGEVIISCPQAIRQAEEHGHPPKHEMAVLTVHGALHLLGYDHQSDEEEQMMKSRETEILIKLID